jgi:hypothetical protein
VTPPRRQPHQIGVQGGFLVVRPNATDFQQYIDIILSGGNFSANAGWGGPKLKYGGYYGAGTIQGLASYYYGHHEPDRALELNRCYYNTMVDNPFSERKLEDGKRVLLCRTLEPDRQCQDCRKTELEDIYTSHFTAACGKPDWCMNPAELSSKDSDDEMDSDYRLCMELFREWHKVRLSLENEWRERYLGYMPLYHNVSGSGEYSYYLNFSQGHCRGATKRSYIKMVFPDVFHDGSPETLL